MVKERLNIKLLQLDLAWENPLDNRNKIEKLLSDNPAQADVILFPEMFPTGFTMNLELAEPMDGDTVKWMKQMSVSLKSAIGGSVSIRENGKFYNRFVWCSPQGEIITYNKRHLFRMGEEHENFTAGESLTTIVYHGWKIRPFICYDLRFPVWSRNINNDYDVLINVANWPAARKEAFEILIKARAIENLCYSVGLNRIGIDGNNIQYSGGSLVADPKGKCLLKPLPEEEIAESISLDYMELIGFRNKFPAWKDADNFKLD